MDTHSRMAHRHIALVIMVVGGAAVVGMLSALMVACGLYLTVFATRYALPNWVGPGVFALAWLLPAGFVIGLRVVRAHLHRRMP